MTFNTRIWSTPLMIATSAAVAISGVMMFFHLSEDLVKSMHEWIGIAFVVGMLIHILNHAKPFSRYFSQKLAMGVMLTTLLVAGGFMLSSTMGEHSENPVKMMIGVVQNKPLSALAAFQNLETAELQQRIVNAGFTVESSQASLRDIAEANHTSPFELINIVFSRGETNTTH